MKRFVPFGVLILGLLVAVILGGAMINGLIGLGFALVAVNVMAAALGTKIGRASCRERV